MIRLLEELKFRVYGLPKPQARPRHYGGRVYSPMSDWRKLVQAYATAEKLKCKQFNGPLRIELLFYFERPKSHYRSGKFAHLLKDSAPGYCLNLYDLDNLDKAVLDALTDSGLIADDRIIVSLSSSKFWDDNKAAGVLISILNLNQKQLLNKG